MANGTETMGRAGEESKIQRRAKGKEEPETITAGCRLSFGVWGDNY